MTARKGRGSPTYMHLDIQRSEWTADLVEEAEKHEIEGENGERRYDPSNQRAIKSMLVGASGDQEIGPKSSW